MAHCNTHACNVVCVDGYCLSTVTWLCSLLCSDLLNTETNEMTLSKDCRKSPLARKRCSSKWLAVSVLAAVELRIRGRTPRRCGRIRKILADLPLVCLRDGDMQGNICSSAAGGLQALYLIFT